MGGGGGGYTSSSTRTRSSRSRKRWNKMVLQLHHHLVVSAAALLLVLLITLNLTESTAAAHNSKGESHHSSSIIHHQLSSAVAGRNLLQQGEDGSISTSSQGTNLGDTVRVDPLDKLKKYRGGFDIRNKHYWSSTIFTGIYGYAIGTLWLLIGLVYGLFLLTTTLCCKNGRKGPKLKKRKHQPCSTQCSLWPILLGISFAILAIAASGVVLGGSSRFHSRAKTIMDIIIETADGASGIMYNATGAMRNVRDNLGTSDEDRQVSRFLNRTSQTLDKEAAEISRQANKNRKLINKGLKIVYIVTTVAVSLNLVAVIALSVTGCLKLRPAFHTLIVLCWLLAVLCWVFFGLYFFLDNFVGDTCTALQDFQQDPRNSSLSTILPCEELDSAKSVLLDTKTGIYNLVNEVNANISASVPNLAFRVCNPFTGSPEYNYQPDNCPDNTIRIRDISQVLKVVTCSNADGTCKAGELISTSDFRRVETYTSSIQNLLDVLPGMESLVDCRIVSDAFTEILSKHCKPVKNYVKMVWSAMVALSIITVIMIPIWTIKACHDQKSHFSDGSVKPYSAEADVQEPPVTAKAGIYQSENQSIP